MRVDLAVFIKSGQRYRFNQLYKEVKLSGIKITKPTFIEHLRHLEEKKLILKEEVDKLNISYGFNHELLGDIDRHIREQALSNRIIDEKMRKFNSLPVKDQLSYVHNMYVITDLLILRDFIDAFVDDDKELLFQVNQNDYEKRKMAVANRLLKNCQEKGESYVAELKDVLEKLIDSYFAQSLSPTNPAIE